MLTSDESFTKARVLFVILISGSSPNDTPIVTRLDELLYIFSVDE